MRILQVHNTYKHPGGEDKVVNEESKLLKESNHSVKTLLFENTNLRRFPYNNESYRTTSENIKTFQPDILHIHNVFYKATPSVIQAANDHGTPVVVTLHNFRLLCPNAYLLRKSSICTKCVNKSLKYPAIRYRCFQGSILKSALLAYGLYKYQKDRIWSNFVDGFICLTEFQKKIFLESDLGIREDSVFVKGNSVSPVSNIEKQRSDYFVYVGRLSKEKGVHTLVEAFNRRSDKLYIVGDGPEKQYLMNKANTNITFTGNLPNAEALGLLSKSRALIFPSIWYEGLPTTILESFSTGTPVIFSDLPNINEIVTNTYNGMAFKPADPDSLNEAINQFNGSDTTELYKNSLHTYRTTYHPGANLKGLSAIYDRILSPTNFR